MPYFEKMLYDQAQLANTYLDAGQITRDPFFDGVARDVLDYVRISQGCRPRLHPGGRSLDKLGMTERCTLAEGTQFYG